MSQKSRTATAATPRWRGTSCGEGRDGDDLGVAYVPPPVEIGDTLELGRGPLFPLKVVDLVDTRRVTPLAALVKVAPASMLATEPGRGVSG